MGHFAQFLLCWGIIRQQANVNPNIVQADYGDSTHFELPCSESEDAQFRGGSSAVIGTCMSP